jgi:hypothetical protein
MKILYPKNSQFLQISGLKDKSQTPAAYINTATLTASLLDSGNNQVSGAANMPGTYQTGSSGVYRFAVDPSLFNPPVGTGYTLVVDGTFGSLKYHVEIPVQVVSRAAGTEN